MTPVQGKRRPRNTGKRKPRRTRRRQPRQASIEFKPTGHGGARPGAGRPRTRRSRVAHRSRGAIPGHCPVLVTLRVRDDVPPLRKGCFDAGLPGDAARVQEPPRVHGLVHYSIQDDHAHFLIEAAGALRLANGMKSLAARNSRGA